MIDLTKANYPDRFVARNGLVCVYIHNDGCERIPHRLMYVHKGRCVTFNTSDNGRSCDYCESGLDIIMKYEENKTTS